MSLPYPFDRHKNTLGGQAWTQRTYFNGSPTPSATVAVDLEWVAKDMLGVNTTDFFKRKERGDLLPHTNFRKYEQDHIFTPSTYYQKLSNGSQVEITGYSYAQSRGHQLGGVTHLVDDAYAEYYVQQAAANIAQSGWDALTFAGELPDLVRMWRTTAKRMTRLFNRRYDRDGRRPTERQQKAGKRLFHGLDTSKDLSWQNLWLEGRYGWRTLAYDIRDMFDAYNNWDDQRRIWTERSGASYSEQSVDEFEESWSAGKLITTRTDTTSHSVRGAVAALFTPARISLDPVQTAWELTRFSFVVDKFLSIGVALAAAKLQLLAKKTTASIGVKSSTTRTVDVRVIPDAGDIMKYSETYTGHYTQFERTPTSISLTPVLTGRKLDGSIVLDLRALSDGFTRPLRR